MTNDDIYKLINFIIRKESKGSPDNLINFSRLLQQANLNHFKEEYQIYQVNQNVNDSISPFEVRQLVSGLTTSATTITLPTDYAHFIGMYWTDADSLDRAFDLVTDDIWDMRCGSVITIPRDKHPICKLIDTKLYVKPNIDIYNDWFLPSQDELDQMYINLHLFGLGDFKADDAFDFYWSSSEVVSFASWGHCFFNNNSTDVGKAGTILVRAVRYFTADAGTYSLRDAGEAGGLIFYIDGTTYYEAAPSDQSASQVWSNVTATLIGTTGTVIGTGQQNTLNIIGQVGHTNSAAKLCNDLSILSGEDGLIHNDTIILYYLKYPVTPVYDYYRDVNGNYVYLAEGEVHTWAVGETDSDGNVKAIGDTTYNDWFLPSSLALEEMYDILHVSALGGFSGVYWSSTEADADDATLFSFTIGAGNVAVKSTSLNVRPMRSFTAASGAYALRDVGQAGGYIFYIDGTTYYEAAPADSSAGAWSNVLATLLGGTSTAISSSSANTTLIINQAGHTASAAKTCDDYVGGTKSSTSTTIELEWKDQDKEKIAARILRTMGLNLKEGEVFQYAQQLKSEE